MNVLLTSTSDKNIEFNYRLPNKQIATVTIPAYALNHSVYFASEDLYESFKTQNKIYFAGDKPVLLEGKESGSKAEKIFNAREGETAKKIIKKAKEATDQIAAATQDSGVKVSVEVESTGAGK